MLRGGAEALVVGVNVGLLDSPLLARTAAVGATSGGGAIAVASVTSDGETAHSHTDPRPLVTATHCGVSGRGRS